MRILLLPLALGALATWLPGCHCGAVPDGALFACGPDDTCPSGQRCEDGLCVTGEAGSCAPETAAEFCARLGRNCGAVADTDNCGMDRVAACGDCPEGEVCGGGGTPNVCAACAEAEDEVLCLRDGLACGEATAVDFCGQPRLVQCGTCPANDMCVANQCCASETDAQLCAAAGWACGAAATTDRCGQVRQVECGACDDGQSCTANRCSLCTPESAASLCARHSRDCGAFSGTDNCGTARSVNCGGCPAGFSCGADGRENVCGCVERSCS